MTLNEIRDRAHITARVKGFWDADTNPTVAQKLALIHSEVSEALEADRAQSGKPGRLEEELADVIIRVADLAGYLNIDLETVVQQKMDHNDTRPRRHGKRY